jgi:hypothetical protein
MIVFTWHEIKDNNFMTIHNAVLAHIPTTKQAAATYPKHRSAQYKPVLYYNRFK